MTIDTVQLLPDGLSVWVALTLIAVSFLTSMITAMFSLGGGMAMLATLGLFFPPAVIIPVHGLVQLGSNAGRAVVQRAHIQWHLMAWFGAGSVLGIVLGGSLAVSIPEALFQIVIGMFILYCVWVPQPRVTGRGAIADFAAGALIGGVGMFVGAVGPLVANFLRKLDNRHQLIATQASLMTLNNIAKVAIFTMFGFAFAQYLPMAIAMIITGILGTLVGSRMLDRVSERVFRIGFKAILTLMALEMLRQAVWG
ncbi:sulfite exporter TauE/SafE family protein [Pelagibacterium sp.]|uniref:sulfite exporter TauE/SafE family protein n=1 Tax=Pelagibacterium sp. TaxID=1967288 RepID=UPI003A923F97